jgi:hypothetical protein
LEGFSRAKDAKLAKEGIGDWAGLAETIGRR